MVLAPRIRRRQIPPALPRDTYLSLRRPHQPFLASSYFACAPLSHNVRFDTCSGIIHHPPAVVRNSLRLYRQTVNGSEPAGATGACVLSSQTFTTPQETDKKTSETYKCCFRGHVYSIWALRRSHYVLAPLSYGRRPPHAFGRLSQYGLQWRLGKDRNGYRQSRRQVTLNSRSNSNKHHTSERTRVPIQDGLDFSLDVFCLELRQNALEVLEALPV